MSVFMKKYLALLLCALLLLPAIAGCSSGNGQTSPDTTGNGTGDGPSAELSTSASASGKTQSASSGATADDTQSPDAPTDVPSVDTVTPPPEHWQNEGAISAPVTAYALSAEYADMTDIELARRAAAEGMVLLENNNDALPLKAGEKVALFGTAQIDFVKGGSGSGDVNALYTVNLLEGMKNKAAEGKIVLNEDLVARYEKNKHLSLTASIVSKVAELSETAVIVISRTSGENLDLYADKFVLSNAEQTLIRKVCAGGFRHVILVLNIGAVMSTAALSQFPEVDAVLICWQPGLEGGNATADVLCGDVTPSGKLADTIAKSYANYPSAPYFNIAAYAEYTEDIFVGYRYFETFDPDYSTVLYPFGYGLSYTTFDLSEPYIREDGGIVETQVLVTNTGNRPGKEVVQVYCAAPTGKLGAPGKVLAGFAKTKLLQPGEWEVLTVSFSIDDLAMYDDTGKIAQYAYILEAGDYGIYVGNSVKDASARGVRFTHKEETDRIVAQLDGKIAGTTLNERLTADGTKEKLDTTVGYALQLCGGTTIISSFDYLNYYEHLGQKIEGHVVANSDGTVGGIRVANNAEITYKVDAPADGDYQLFFGYGMSGTDTVENALSVSVNGAKVAYTLTGTGGQFVRKTTSPATVHLNKGGNYVTITTPANATATFTLIDLTFDNPEGSSLSDLTQKYQPQSLNTASGETIDFKDVYDDPSLLDRFLDSLTPAQMIYTLIGHSANVGRGDGSIAGLKDLGVPCVDLSDGPAGLDLAIRQVAWPIETALACTWDTSLLYAVGTKVAQECYAAGVDIILGPGVNIHRDPLGGRNFEYYSEDPLITGKMASAFTQGVQQSGKAGVMPKHFYANSRESGRVNGNSSISERAARMIYMKAFEICVKEAQPVSIMTTYNLANGIFNAENIALLDGVVRGEWGFKGFFCTDWGSHSENAREIAAGNDVKMMFDFTTSDLAAFRCGFLPLAQLRACCRRVLETALHSGSMDRMLNPVVYVHEINGGTTRIKAAELATRTDGVNFEECLDEDGGINPNYLQNGAVVTYLLDVKKAGTYGMSFRVASENSGVTFKIYVDDVLIGAGRLKQKTGGWQIWTTVDFNKQFELTEGEHELKFVFATAININWFELIEK